MENTETMAVQPKEGLAKKLYQQFGKFILVGIMNTLVDLIILNIETILSGTREGTGYAIQKGFSFLVAVIFSYALNKNWTFEDKSKEQEGKKFTQFLFVSVIGMVINVTAATVAVTYIKPLLGLTFIIDQLWVSVGGLCGTAAGLLWNFIGYKFWVFKK
jgi:putative flippase GtrA